VSADTIKRFLLHSQMALLSLEKANGRIYLPKTTRLSFKLATKKGPWKWFGRGMLRPPLLKVSYGKTMRPNIPNYFRLNLWICLFICSCATKSINNLQERLKTQLLISKKGVDHSYVHIRTKEISIKISCTQYSVIPHIN